MKKSITLLLAILMVVSVFAACGKPAEGPESSTPPSDSNAPETGGNGTDAPSTEGPGGETTPPETEPQNEYVQYLQCNQCAKNILYPLFCNIHCVHYYQEKCVPLVDNPSYFLIRLHFF